MGDCCSYDARGINDMNASWVCLDRRNHSWCVVSTGEVLLLTMCFVPGTSKYVDWCITRPTYVWQQQPDLPLLDLSVFLFERSEFLIDTSQTKNRRVFDYVAAAVLAADADAAVLVATMTPPYVRQKRLLAG